MRRAQEVLLAIALGALVALIAVAVPACKSAFGVAWKATYGVKQAGELASHTIGTIAREKHEKCLKAYPSRSTEYATCIGPTRKLLDKWIRIAKPAINSALSATVGALLIAEKAKAEKATNLTQIWSLIKPGLCALTEVVQSWAHLMPKATAEKLRGYLSLAKGVTCG